MSNILIQPLPNREQIYDSVIMHDNYTTNIIPLLVLEDIYNNALTDNSPILETPSEIKVPLRLHQKAMISAMERMEYNGLHGIKKYNETLYTNSGILGDRVGVGKSLMVLSHIANMRKCKDISYNTTSLYNCQTLFSIKNKIVKDEGSATLIIVPHNLYRQWKDYIDEQTTLRPYYVKSKNPFLTPESKRKCISDILAADLTLVSNTLCGELMSLCHFEEGITWKRVFVDEADTIHITSTTPRIKAGFVWFITASWANFIFSYNKYIKPSHFDYIKKYAFHPEVKNWMEREFATSSGTMHTPIHISHMFDIRSDKYFKEYLPAHPMRGEIVLLNSPEFLDASIKMPIIHDKVIMCLQTISSSVLGNIIGEDVKRLLHVGDVKGALLALGVSEHSNISLIQAVNYARQKDLDNYNKTLAFKETLEYVTENAKQIALKNLRDKIHSLEEQIHSFKERVENVKTELCGICYDEPEPATITPCCHQIFCGRCIIMSLEKNTECPMCRKNLQKTQLVMINNTIQIQDNEVDAAKNKDSETVGPLKKQDTLLNLIKANPTGKFLVFSRYDNPFESIATACKTEGIHIREVKGNKDVINSILHKFDNGDIQVLFLNSMHSGSGLNIISATHIVLLHAMTSEEVKQIVGRAFRLGRKDDLHLIRLLHPTEHGGN